MAVAATPSDAASGRRARVQCHQSSRDASSRIIYHEPEQRVPEPGTGGGCARSTARAVTCRGTTPSQQTTPTQRARKAVTARLWV